MIDLKGALESIGHDNDWDDILTGAKIIDIWNDIRAETGNNPAKVLKFENGTLFLKAKSSSWKTEINLRKKEIMTRINQLLNSEKVFDIKVRN